MLFRLMIAVLVFLPLSAGAEENRLDAIIVVGERTSERSALETSRPVDILSAEDIRTASGQTQTGKILRSLLPSFHTPESTISDGTDSLRPAALRGLGPDQTLVLINGKRRHSSALVHVNGSYGRGTAGVDFAAIPAAAIGSVEVLRDGAAAQYGSDAIAGVINIRLADQFSGGQLAFQSGQTYEGDGARHYFSAAGGTSFAKIDVALSGEIEIRDKTYRGGQDGTCQYPHSTPCGNPLEDSFDRHSFHIGDADADSYALAFNARRPLANRSEAYGFAIFSLRESESGGFYRTAANANNNIAIYPDGFLPRINTDILDAALAAGLKGWWGQTYADFSLSYAQNEFDFNVSNSLNATYAGTDIATEADSGGFELSQLSLNLDAAREFLWQDLPFALAFGAEWRLEQYAINEGEPYSYIRCQDDPNITDADAQCRTGTAPGIQVFPGFSPDNALDVDRSVFAFYLDAETEPAPNVSAGLAARFETYEDVDESFALHVRSRYDVSPQFAVRGSLGTGFRAPSLQQIWFNNSSTQFDGTGQRFEVGTFNASHDIAKALQIPELEPEESLHLAAGTVLRLTPRLSITMDAYQIDVDDRIVLSGRISSGRAAVTNACLIGGEELDDASLCELYETNHITAAQFFINLTQTQTRGLDVAANWQGPSLYGFASEVIFALAYTDTKIKGAPSAAGRLAEVEGLEDKIFSAFDKSLIEDAAPRLRVTLTGKLTAPDWQFRAGLRHYGSYSITEGERQKFSPKTLLDVEAAYRLDSGFSIALGAENLFDVTPDRTKISRSRACSAAGVTANTCHVESDGVFLYNRRTTPFGFNGGFYYMRLTQSF